MKRSRGAPRKQIDLKKLEASLAFVSENAGILSKERIAEILGISKDTLDRRIKDGSKEPDFCGAYKKGIDGRKQKLHALQWKCAEHKLGDSTMLIWLGKQWLGQRNEEEQQREPVEVRITQRIVE